MPWLRGGDTAANHPVVLAVLEDERCDDRLLNEAFGFVWRCALQSTAHLTDYIISHGTAVQMAGQARAQELIDVALAAGYFTEVVYEDGRRKGYKLINDDTFIHMRTREEIEWERQRKLDNSNPALTIPVRLRDGDACRYCGLVVNFQGDRRGQKAGTYDHLDRQVQSPKDMVVACGRCNAALLDAPRAHREKQMMPPPKKPYFKPKTLEWLRTHEYVITHNIVLPDTAEADVRAGRVPPGRDAGTAAQKTPENPASRSEGQPATQAERDPAGDVHRPEGPHGNPSCDDPAVDTVWSEGLSATQAESDPAGTGSGPKGPPDTHQSECDPAEPPSRFQQVPAGRVHPGSGYAGSGRDGKGSVRDGTGRAGPGRSAPPVALVNSPAQKKRKRRKR
ncbi:hypothetical protein KTJ89_11340 [Brevibacterium sediminis]|uniref:hypothetical protein n=1 Tax=Brevibacterium sediminis TaxID=1857024 RepID=UPI002174F787|nr:hypothetical protein [Brevibacterium sediminis]MCS4593575.1 hypothetical protein [Brevibacterium sediminis]